MLQQLINGAVNGSTFISIDTETDVKLTGGKANPFQGRVKKRQVGSNVMVFQNKHVNGYSSMVSRRLEKEGKDPSSFILGPRKWGTRIPNTPFITHNGEVYLEVIFLKAGNVDYMVDGNVVDPSTITGLPVKQEAEQGGLTDKVVIRTFKESSVVAIVINKTRHIL